jgi:hypothetical protein
MVDDTSLPIAAGCRGLYNSHFLVAEMVGVMYLRPSVDKLSFSDGMLTCARKREYGPARGLYVSGSERESTEPFRGPSCEWAERLRYRQTTVGICPCRNCALCSQHCR